MAEPMASYSVVMRAAHLAVPTVQLTAAPKALSRAERSVENLVALKVDLMAEQSVSHSAD